MKTSEPSGDPSALEHLFDAAGAEAASLEELDTQGFGAATGARTVPWKRLRIAAGHNPRKAFDWREIKRLAATILAQGLLQPIVVRPAGDQSGDYLVTAGERRYRALARLVERGDLQADDGIPVIVREHEPRDALLAALIENLQRSNLAPFDEAEAFAELRDEHGMSTAEIANALGMTQRTVQLRLQLLQLTPHVRAALRSGEIAFDVARVLAGAPPEEQRNALASYRAASPELQNAEAVRAALRARFIPFSRALFAPRIYTRAHQGAVYDGGRAGKFFCDRQLFLRLQHDAISTLRTELAETREWVEVIKGRHLPEGYEILNHPSAEEPGLGALIVLANGCTEIHVHRAVRYTDPATTEATGTTQAEKGARPRGRTPSQAALPKRPPTHPEPPLATADEIAEPGSPEDAAPPSPSPSRSSRRPASPSARTHPGATRVRTAPLQDALASRPETALRLVLASILGRGDTDALLLAPPGRTGRPELGPRVTQALRSVATALNLSDTPSELAERITGRRSELPDEVGVYRRLARLPAPALHRIHAALVALAAASPCRQADGQPAASTSRPLLVQIASDLGLHVRRPFSSRHELEALPLDELRSLAIDHFHLDLPKTAGPSEIVDVILAARGEAPAASETPPGDASGLETVH